MVENISYHSDVSSSFLYMNNIYFSTVDINIEILEKKILKNYIITDSNVISLY